ncbi:hypothetical protein [Comamonas sp.]|uniref:hypothetical protein n=1 Tax=Comamonas sp. TaxID=34028 RepID=UPI0028986E5D|nr:hypothetical protein [Comamonas sp.]
MAVVVLFFDVAPTSASTKSKYPKVQRPWGQIFSQWRAQRQAVLGAPKACSKLQAVDSERDSMQPLQRLAARHPTSMQRCGVSCGHQHGARFHAIRVRGLAVD